MNLVISVTSPAFIRGKAAWFTGLKNSKVKKFRTNKPAVNVFSANQLGVKKIGTINFRVNKFSGHRFLRNAFSLKSYNVILLK